MFQRIGPRLRVLFVGGIGLHKGAHHLLETLWLARGSPIEARFAGGFAFSVGIWSRYSQVARFLAHLPRSEVAAQYRWANVLCLPSLCEDSATVIYEALMQGLAVIATTSAGPPPADTPYGITVEARSNAKAIVKAIRRYLDDPDLPGAHRQRELNSHAHISREAYAARLLATIRSLEPGGSAP